MTVFLRPSGFQHDSTRRDWEYNRRKVTRKARSKMKRLILLAELERRYRETANS